MTVTTNVRKVEYVGNGTTVDFNYSFKIYDRDHVKVSIITLATGVVTELTDSQYLITGVGYTTTGGTVTYPPSGAALTSGQMLRIERVVPYTQEQAIGNQAGFQPETVERTLDQLVMMVQQLADPTFGEGLPPVPGIDTFTADGTADYTLSQAPVDDNHLVYISGIYQNKSTYTVTGTTLLFDEAPEAGLQIEVVINGVGGTGSGGGSTPISSTDITDFEEAVTDLIGSNIIAGTNITLAFNDTTNQLTINSTASGGGSGGGSVAASAVSFTPSSGIDATNVQSAILEVAAERAALTHTHTASQVTDFNESVDDRVASLLVAGSNVSLTYNDGAGTLTIAATGGGGGTSGWIRPEDAPGTPAVGNGVADDTAALTWALQQEGPVLLTGYYRIVSNIAFGTTYSPRGKTVMGFGGKGILCDSTTAGLTWTASTPDIYQEHMLVFHNVVMMANAVTTTPALNVVTTGGSGATTKTFDIRNVATFGTTPTNRFAIGIRLENQRGGVLDGCNYEGNRSGTPGAHADQGIYMTGTSDPVEINITNCRGYFCNSAIQIAGTHEGVNIDNCVAVGTDFGVYVEVDENPISGDNEGKPLFRVTNSHFNVNLGGVFMVRARDFYISGNDMLTWTANSNMIGIQATTGGAASQYGYIGGNKIQDAFGVSSGTTIGVRLNGVATGGLFTLVAENRYVSLKRGLSLESNARYVKYSAGSIYANCTTNVLNAGSLNEEYGGSGGGGGMSDAALLARANHTGDEPHATRFAYSGAGTAEGGELRLQKPDSSSLAGDLIIDVTSNTFRVFESGGSSRGASLDIASQAAVGSTAFITSTNQGIYAAAGAYDAIGNYALLADPVGGAPGGTISGASSNYAHAGGGGGPSPPGTWRRMGYTPSAGTVTLFQRIS